MKKLFCIIFLKTFLIADCFTQNNLPPVYYLTLESDYYKLDTAHYQVLEDWNNNLTLEQVLKSPLNEQFHTDFDDDERKNPKTTWVRMGLKNTQENEIKVYLSNNGSDFFDFYRRDTLGKWTHQRTGNLVSLSETDKSSGLNEQSQIYFELGSNEEVLIYLRLEVIYWHPRLRNVAPNLLTQEQMKQAVFEAYKVEESWKHHLFEGIMVGILLLATFYNLFVYYATKDKVYLYFGLSLLFFTVDRHAEAIQPAYFYEFPLFFSFCYNFFFIFFFVFFIASIRLFLQPEIQCHKYNKLITYALGLTALSAVSTLFIYNFPNNIVSYKEFFAELVIRFTYLPLFIINILLVREGHANAKFSLVATAPLFTLWMISFINTSFYFFWEVSVFKSLMSYFSAIEGFCLTWLVVVFSGALISRYNQYRNRSIMSAIENEQREKEIEIERNKLIEQQKENLEIQVQERTAELNQSLETLKATQTQLIQSEKLASLGELTAGIAHEIQNPLNFVNNFSELSVDLAHDLKEEMEKIDIPEKDKSYITELLTDLSQNQIKINHHGKRASSIVKGMLEHSRASTGVKELTDINVLTDEYLRLSYHGLRAKDKSFNADFKTDFDMNLPKIEVIPQDLGRVLLNLINNAFYAVNQRKQHLASSSKLDTSYVEDYTPSVFLSTQQLENQIVIKVKDNGTGMPESVKAKIFQPFFTTKPTGQGTGLGLSLAYDIVTKGHGGSLEVVSTVVDAESVGKEVGTEFIIRLPMAL
jgi:two-component system, NtrC family, sensor kinase